LVQTIQLIPHKGKVEVAKVITCEVKISLILGIGITKLLGPPNKSLTAA
jgi:hypothetical protein